MLGHDDTEVGGDLRHAALVFSTSVWKWTETAGLGVVDGNVLLALSEGHDVHALDVSARSGLPLDAVYPALHRLTDRGYALEEHRQHRLTTEGRRLVADFDRFAADGSIAQTEGMS